MWAILISLLMAFIIGSIGNSLVRGGMPGGLIGSIIAGLAGTWLGTLLFGTWGPLIAGFPIIPAIIGAAIFVFLISLMGRALQRGTHD